MTTFILFSLKILNFEFITCPDEAQTDNGEGFFDIDGEEAKSRLGQGIPIKKIYNAVFSFTSFL